MKRDSNIFNYGHMSRCQEIYEKRVDPVIDELEKKEVVNGTDVFLSLVYAPDPISKLPTGDLCYMVSDKANPEVKAFVLQNLQMDTSSAVNLKAPDGLSDDDIIALTRQKNETLDQYAERINIFMQNNKTLVDAALERSQRNVSPESKGSSVSSE